MDSPSGPSDNRDTDSSPRSRRRSIKSFAAILRYGIISILSLGLLVYLAAFIFVEGFHLLGPERASKLIEKYMNPKPKAADPRREDILYIAQDRAAMAMGVNDWPNGSLPPADSFERYDDCTRCYEAQGRVPKDKQQEWGKTTWRVIVQVDDQNGIRAVYVAVGSKVLLNELASAPP